MTIKLKLFVSIVVCVCAVITYSCTKEDQVNEQSFPPKTIKSSSKTYIGVQNINNRLVFDDFPTFHRIKTQLEQLHNNSVDTIDEDIELRTFEADLNFSSLRAHLEVQELTLLDQGVHPIDIPEGFILDDLTQTFFNPQNIIQVGDTIIYLPNENYAYMVYDGNETTLADLENGGDPYGHENVGVEELNSVLNCDASFEYGVTPLYDPLDPTNTIITGWNVNVSYTGDNTITDPNTEIYWTADGITSNTPGEVKTFTYNTAGVYSICVVVVQVEPGGGTGGMDDMCSDRQCKSVVLGDGCNADFDFTLGQNAIVNFTDLSTSQNPLTVVSWLWTFGDGQTSTEQNPTHTYPCNGNYDARLTITCSDNQQYTVEKTIKVESDVCCEKSFDKDWKNHDYTFDGEPRYFKYKTAQRNWLLEHCVKAKMKAYKPKNNGNGWKTDRRRMRITFIGEVFKIDENECICSSPEDITGNTNSTNGRKKNLDAKWCNPGSFNKDNHIRMKENFEWDADYYIEDENFNQNGYNYHITYENDTTCD
ncbi:MAG: PKD domain-containing protein [Chitinophagales bacterium]